MIIPYRVYVTMYRSPISNMVIIVITIAFFLLFWSESVSTELAEALVLDDWDLDGMLGHVLLHAGWIHLLGNMIFLWVFGGAVCAKVGNLAFLLLYAAFALASAATHLAMSGAPAVGASGAINGVVGMYLVWYPLNEVSCFYWFWMRAGTFHVSSIWMILFWLIFDILGAAIGMGGIAYWAHLGGFAAGFVIGCVLLRVGAVKMREGERSLADIFRKPR